MSDPTAAPELKTYHGNCHCGTFKFHILIPELATVTECACSICFKKGYKWVFPGANAFFIDKGDETTLTDYHFGQKVMAHQFCPNCGTAVLGKRHIERLGLPADMEYGVNARSLQALDGGLSHWSLASVHSDTISREPQYVPAPFAGELPVASPDLKIENPKTYTGACHCGLVTIALVANGALTDGKEYIQECNCSICTRNGTTLIYPHTSQVTITNLDKLSGYVFGRKFQSHDFCPVCGVAVLIRKFDLEPERWPNGQERYLEWRSVVPLNLRLLEGVEWPLKLKEGEKSIEVKRGTWKTWGIPYVVPE